MVDFTDPLPMANNNDEQLIGITPPETIRDQVPVLPPSTPEALPIPGPTTPPVEPAPVIPPEPETSPEPAPVPVPDTMPEPTPIAPPQPIAETMPAPQPLPDPAPTTPATPPPDPVITVPDPTPPVIPPSPPPPDPSAIPAAVLALTDAELRIAASYYLQRHHAEISQRGVQARQHKMQQSLDAIMAYAKSHSSDEGIKLPRLAYEINVSPGTTSHYLRILVKQGKLTATGWGTTRSYHL